MTNPWNSFNTGSVMPFAGKSIPEGWLLCDGGSYKIDIFPHLFSVIGNKYGEQKDSFCVPNYNGCYIRGESSNHPIGTLTQGKIKRHTHNIHLLLGGEHVHKYPDGGITWAEAGSYGHSRAFPADDGYEFHDGKPYFKQNFTTEVGGLHTHRVILANNSGDNSSEKNNPASIGVSFGIKY